MAKQERFKTKYPGVYFIETTVPGGKPEKVYYIRYRRKGKMIEEKVGKQFQDDMTPARASGIRALRIQGDESTNREQREQERRAEAKWTINRLWEEYKAGKPNLKGIVTDENRYAKHIKPLFGEKEPGEIVPLDVDRLRVKMLKTHEAATVRNALELLRRIINFGADKQLSPKLGFTIEMPEVDNVTTEDLTPDQLARLLEEIESTPHVQAANLMKMVLFTGMRRGELFRLEWTDLDFERGFIRLRDPKGGKSQSIPMNTEARKLLKKILENPEWTESPFVFPGRGGKKRVDIHKTVKRIKVAAGLPEDFRALHGLRHVYASMLASSGQVDMYTLQKLMTHKGPQMTQRYAFLRDEALRKGSDLAGSIVGQAMKGTNGDTGKVVNFENARD